MVMAEAGVRSLKKKITALKEELKAVIVAHNYQRPEVQDIADFVGDSLELARECTRLSARVIVFCGVQFMAETAAILNSERTVLLTGAGAECPLANMITANELKGWQARYPEAAAVCYVNSSAEVKAESYISCTSANGVAVVESVPHDEIIFIPDQNLGNYIAAQTKKRLILYPGFCYVHHRIIPEQVALAKRLHPKAKVIVHPECRPEVVTMADAVLSTSQMLRYVKTSSHQEFIIGTEAGIIHRLRKQNPAKSFYLISNSQVCTDMKKTTLETLAETMELRQNVVNVPQEIRVRAKIAIERMLAIG
jgi:quinolinate synthase